MPNHNIVRESIFEPDSVDIKQSGNRRRGRPRNTWAIELKKRALLILQNNCDCITLSLLCGTNGSIIRTSFDSANATRCMLGWQQTLYNGLKSSFVILPMNLPQQLILLMSKSTGFFAISQVISFQKLNKMNMIFYVVFFQSSLVKKKLKKYAQK